MEDKQIFSDPKRIYQRMISDIRKAKEEILLETYLYGDDKIGRLFRDELMKKAVEGVRIKVLIDGWGTEVKRKFFKGLTGLGAKVRFFREFKYTWSFIDDNYERNHRKLLIVDGRISYIGSINITARCLGWSELVLRIEGNLGVALRRSFNRSWKKFNIWGKRKMRKIVHEGYEVLHGFPSNLNHSYFERRYRRLIGKAQKEILIETPYFVPSSGIRKAIKDALSRGVKVKLVLPQKSDVWLVDVVRNRYLGNLHRAGVKIFYHSKFLHSKLLIIDEELFLFGSSNLDYRSFLYQYEINLFGRDKDLIEKLKKHFSKNLRESSRFSYGAWRNRRNIGKLVERLIEYFKRHL
jgi:cardiolipin synthase A/B